MTWAELRSKANNALTLQRGAKSAAARHMGVERQELRRILNGEREPQAGATLALLEYLETISRKALHYSSATDEWSTPQWLFDKLNSRFHFTIDVAASATNAKCPRFYDRTTDGLKQSWKGETVWLNPPYGKHVVAWMKKAAHESTGATIVILLSARTDSVWWHNYINTPHNRIVFLKGRLRFGDAASVAPFPSAIVIMGKPRNEAERHLATDLTSR